MYKYKLNPKRPVLATDGIILKNDKILLVKRAIEPFLGFWVLPGGHVNYGERVEEALLREIKEELGIKVKIKRLVGVYSDPKRDKRYHIISIVYLLEPTKREVSLDKEASEFKYFSLKKLPHKIGFDHKKAINDFLKNYDKSNYR